MAYTSRLGKSSNARFSNIRLGTVDSLTSPYAISVPDSRYFTGILGISRSVLSHIVLGRWFMRLLAAPVLPGNLSFLGRLRWNLKGRLPFPSSATITTQSRSITLKVVQRTTTQLDTLPAVLDIGSTELYPLGVDFTQYVASGDTLSAPSAVLKLKSNQSVIPNTSWLVNNSMSINGNIVQVPMNISALTLGQTYTLALTVNLNTNKTLTSTTTFNVVV